MSPGVIQVRADICGDCPTPCEWQRDSGKHRDPCATCPIRRWSQWGDCYVGDVEKPAPKFRGLGDVVAFVADPVAKVIGLDKAKCGCAKRQEALNHMVPFK